MKQLFIMAFCDLGRNRRRSFFSALALGMGLALLMLIAATLQGEMRSSLEASLKLQSGHLQVQAKSYDEDKTSLSWDDLIVDPLQVAGQIASMPQVKVATPRLYASGIIAKGEETIGIRVMGIDPASEANAPYRQGLVSGQFLDAGDREGILIGQTLADQLNLKSGDKMDLLVNTSGGDMAEQVFIIRGVYTTHTPSFDQSVIFMPLDKAQGISQATNRASSIFILLKDRDQAAATASTMLLQPGQYQVKSWQQMNEMLTQTEDMANSYLVILYLIVLAITATVIVNTLVMAVFERTREIGILSAMGMKPIRIMAMFFAESSLLAVGGIAIGLILGGLLVAYASYIGFYIGNFGITGFLLGERIYAFMTLKDTVTLSITAFVVALLAALYPALLAARMEPVEALHGGK